MTHWVHVRVLDSRCRRNGFEQRKGSLTAAVVCAWLLGVAAIEAATVRGRVYDAATGQAVMATVSVVVPPGAGQLRLDPGLPAQGPGGAPVVPAERADIPRIGADGWFEVGSLAAGRKLVIAYPLLPGYALGYSFVDLLNETDMQVVDVALQKAASVAGRIVVEAGQTVPGARVGIVYTDPEMQRFVIAGGHARQEVKVDEFGAFSFEPVIKPGTPFRLEVLSPEHPPAFSELLTLQPGERRDGILVRLEQGFRLVVDVVDAEGQPLAGVPVVLRSKVRPPRELMLSETSAVPLSGHTDPQGRIEFKGLAPGAWVIAAADSTRPGPGSRMMKKEVELPAQAALKEIQVTLRPE